MLLNYLKSIEEKENFSALALYLMKSEGHFNYPQKLLFDLYLKELETPFPSNSILENDAILNKLCRFFENHPYKDIVYANLLLLAQVDHTEKEDENTTLTFIQEKLHIDLDTASKYMGELAIMQGDFFPDYLD